MALTFHLDHFTGPLDLLLQLLQKNKVSIYDIPIAEILEQYLAVLEAEPVLEMDTAGDFVAMAAQLIYIKSKMLLPRPDEEADEDPRANLVQALLAYQQLQRMIPFFRKHTDVGRDIFVKDPQPISKTPILFYQQQPQDLVRAMRRMWQNTKRREAPKVSAFQKIVRKRYTSVADAIGKVLGVLMRKQSMPWQLLFAQATSRTEKVATFLAVLELSKSRQIRLEDTQNTMMVYFTPDGGRYESTNGNN